MHHHQRLLAASHFEHLEQLFVAQHQVVISHEDFEGSVAVLNERRQFLTENDRSRVGYDEMERCIDVALPLGEFSVFLDTGPQRRTLDLQGKRQNRRIAASRCSACGRSKVVGHHDIGP